MKAAVEACFLNSRRKRDRRTHKEKDRSMLLKRNIENSLCTYPSPLSTLRSNMLI